MVISPAFFFSEVSRVLISPKSLVLVFSVTMSPLLVFWSDVSVLISPVLVETFVFVDLIASVLVVYYFFWSATSVLSVFIAPVFLSREVISAVYFVLSFPIAVLSLTCLECSDFKVAMSVLSVFCWALREEMSDWSVLIKAAFLSPKAVTAFEVTFLRSLVAAF